MKNILIVFLTLCIGTSATLQQDTNDPEAKKILDKIKAKYTGYKDIKVDFTFTMTDKELDEPESYNGKIYLKGKKFRLETDDIEIVSNNKFLWTHLKSSGRLQIQDYDPEVMMDEFGFMPDEIFTVDDNDFHYKLNPETKIGEDAVNEIELTPKDKEKPYYKIKMYSKISDNKVVKVKFYESMSTYEIAIDKQTPDGNLKEDLFSIDESKFDKDKIEDLRTQ